MVQWPTVLTSLCFDGAAGLARRQRVLENCQFGLNLYTEFSGKFTVEVGLSMLANAFDDVALGLPPNWLRFCRACDMCPVSQQIAVNAGMHQHMFTAVRSLLPSQDLRNGVADRSPCTDDSNEFKIGAHALQDRFLKQHEFKLNEYACGGECALHPGESCPVVVPPADLPFLGGTAVDMNWSGPVCLPWCGHGKRSGMADMFIESYNVYKMLSLPLFSRSLQYSLSFF